jgi:hypothetical protein
MDVFQAIEDIDELLVLKLIRSGEDFNLADEYGARK